MPKPRASHIYGHPIRLPCWRCNAEREFWMLWHTLLGLEAGYCRTCGATLVEVLDDCTLAPADVAHMARMWAR